MSDIVIASVISACGGLIVALIGVWATRIGGTGRSGHSPEHETSPRIEARVFATRRAAAEDIKRMIRDAGKNKRSINFLGIAHSDLYGTDPILHEPFDEALQKGATARILFLDPDSPAAARRGRYERGTLTTQQEIKTKIDSAKDHQAQYGNTREIRLTNDIPCYLCFNDQEMVLSPYFTTITGHDSFAILVPSRDKVYCHAKKHFERLWDNAAACPL